MAKEGCSPCSTAKSPREGAGRNLAGGLRAGKQLCSKFRPCRDSRWAGTALLAETLCVLFESGKGIRAANRGGQGLMQAISTAGFGMFDLCQHPLEHRAAATQG